MILTSSSSIAVKRPAWLLILTLPAIVGFVSLSFVTTPSQGSCRTVTTPHQNGTARTPNQQR